jgi:hypothetical protein
VCSILGDKAHKSMWLMKDGKSTSTPPADGDMGQDNLVDAAVPVLGECGDDEGGS